MNIESHSQKVDISEQINSYDCNFDPNDSGYMAKLLRDSIYTKKILAAIREPSSNAMDAHVEAGIQDRPIHVKLPTMVEPTFSCRDFGNGISFENMTSIYRTFGKSTKRNTDFKSQNQAGCFGIGRFAPLSIEGNDSFTVRTFQNGKVGVYEVRIANDNNNTILEIGQFDTEEPNGLEISYSIDKAIVSIFNNTAKECFKYFSVHPTIVNELDYSPDKINSEINGTFDNGAEYYITKDQSRSSLFVIMANIKYDFDKEEYLSQIENFLSKEDFEKIDKLLRNFSIHLKVNAGEVSFPPSRETITFDKKTFKNITEYLLSVANTIIHFYQEKIDNAKTLKEALDFANTIFFINRKVLERSKFNNVSLETFDKFRLSSCKHYYYKWSRSKNVLKNRVAGFVNLYKDDYKLFLKDNKYAVQRIKEFTSGNTSIDAFLLEDLREFENLCELVGGEDKLGIKVIRLSSLPVPERSYTRNQSSSGRTNHIKIFGIKDIWYNILKDNAVELSKEKLDSIDELEQKIYISVQNFRPVKHDYRGYHRAFNLLNINKENVFLIRKNDCKDLDDSWISAEDHIHNVIEQNKYKIARAFINKFKNQISNNFEEESLEKCIKYSKILNLPFEVTKESLYNGVKFYFSYKISRSNKIDYDDYIISVFYKNNTFIKKFSENLRNNARTILEKSIKKVENFEKCFPALKYFDIQDSHSVDFFQHNKDLFAQMQIPEKVKENA